MGEPLNKHSAPPPERITENLERPELDNRTYRIIKLRNKLEALLIHDPDTDKSSGALDVNVGSFSDMEDMPGIAHAVEHLLFMGTKKYPQENAYHQYLSSHSGSSNAYTASTSTNYYFEIAASSTASNKTSPVATTHSEAIQTSMKSDSPLYGALDRFAQFFIEPLFLEDTLDRELRAVDSENKKNLQNDSWRQYQLNKSLSNPAHPFHQFSTGSYQSLHDDPLARGVKIRDEFIKFYKANYSANRMKLAVLGRESLDELEQWVEELFSDIPNIDLPQNRWDGISPYTDAELLTQVFAKPVFDTRILEFYFLYQDEDELYESQPERYLSHLIGHEGSGSILSYVKAKGWATGASAGPHEVGPGSAFFVITVKLTEDGLKHYKEVTKVIFQYIALLRESPPLEWVVEELKRMTAVDFRFKEKSPASRTTSYLAEQMQKPYRREWLLSGSLLVRKFDPEAISKGLSYLRPDNFRLILVSKQFPGTWEKKEKWYGTEYTYEKIPGDFLEEIKKAAHSTASERPPELHLPPQNEFIPTRLEVEKKQIEEPAKAPKLIRKDENVWIWYKKDDRFWTPKANLHITLRSPLVTATPRTDVIIQIYCDLVQDALVEYSYDAQIAGLEYDLDSDSMGLKVSVNGYNDKMSVLLEKVLVSMRDLDVREDRFSIIHERLLRAYRNWNYDQPYSQVSTYSRLITGEHGWSNNELLSEFPHITAADVRSYFPQLLRQAHIEVLAHGNIHKEDALKLTNLIETTLKPRILPSSQWPIRRSLIFPDGGNYLYKHQLADPANVNHCIEYLLYTGENTSRDLRAKTLLVAQIADEPAFDQLRTKEQLGYVVFSSATAHNMWLGYRILIQSERAPEYLEQRVDAFLLLLEERLAAMTEEEFETHKRSLINKRLEKLKNLTQETDRFWKHIVSECYDFEQVDHDVAHVLPLKHSDILSFYRDRISPRSESRAKLSIHLVAQTSTSEEGTTAEHSTVEAKPPMLITDIHAFKAGMRIGKGARPFHDLSKFEDLESKL